MHPSPAYPTDKTLFLVMKNGTLIKLTDTDLFPVNLPSSSKDSNRGALVRTIALSPDYLVDQTLFISTTEGLYKSVNGGVDWQFLGIIEFWEIIASPGFVSDKTLFGINYDDGDVYLSINSGDTWTKIIPSTNGYDILLSPAYLADDTLHVMTGQGFYTSHDKGNNWVLVSPVQFGPDHHLETVVISPGFENDGVVFIGPSQHEEASIHRSTDWGYTWETLTLPEAGYPVFNVSGDFAVDQTLVLAIDQHLYKSTDAGDSWDPVSLELPFSPDILELSPDFAVDSSIWIAGYGEGIRVSSNGGQSWGDLTNDIEPFVTDLEISAGYTADQTLFATIYNDGMFRSDNGGASWLSLGEPTFSPDFRIELSPSFQSDGTLFAGASGISNGGAFRSTDRGDTWVDITSDLLDWYLPTIAVSPKFGEDSTLIMATTMGPLYISEDAGDTWHELAGIPTDPGGGNDQFGAAIGYRDGRLTPIATLSEDPSGIYRYRWPELTTDLSPRVFAVHEEDPPVIQFDLILQTDIFSSPYFELPDMTAGMIHR
jgi:photosystem II stability/assembly factor-like uncharacterized protein